MRRGPRASVATRSATVAPSGSARGSSFTVTCTTQDDIVRARWGQPAGTRRGRTPRLANSPQPIARERSEFTADDVRGVQRADGTSRASRTAMRCGDGGSGWLVARVLPGCLNPILLAGIAGCVAAVLPARAGGEVTRR